MGNLAVCLPVTLGYEGGWVNNPHDPGGATMKGVTQGVYTRYLANHGKTIVSVRHITDAELLDIYDNQYFKPIGGADLEAGVDLVSFDYAVNSGVGAAKKALNYTDGFEGVTRVRKICDRRLSILHGLKTWKYFGKGWGRRVGDVMARGIKMASANAGAASLDLKLASHDHAIKAKQKGKAAAASFLGSGSTSITSIPMSDGNAVWIFVGLALFMAVFGALLFVAIRKHQDVSDALMAASLVKEPA